MTRRACKLLAAPLALGLALAPVAVAQAAPGADEVRSAVRAWRQSHARSVVEDLARLVQLPNVAGNREQMERNARHLFILLRKRGFEARLLLPALNLRGLSAGHVGEQATNSIPTEARASIDFRLVPDQSPSGVQAAVEAHLRRQGFFVVELLARLGQEPRP